MLSQRQIPDYIHYPALVFVLGAPCNASNRMCRPARVGKAPTRPRDLLFSKLVKCRQLDDRHKGQRGPTTCREKKKKVKTKNDKKLPFSFLLIEIRGLNLM